MPKSVLFLEKAVKIAAALPVGLFIGWGSAPDPNFISPLYCYNF